MEFGEQVRASRRTRDEIERRHVGGDHVSGADEADVRRDEGPRVRHAVAEPGHVPENVHGVRFLEPAGGENGRLGEELVEETDARFDRALRADEGAVAAAGAPGDPETGPVPLERDVARRAALDARAALRASLEVPGLAAFVDRALRLLGDATHADVLDRAAHAAGDVPLDVREEEDAVGLERIGGDAEGHRIARDGDAAVRHDDRRADAFSRVSALGGAGEVTFGGGARARVDHGRIEEVRSAADLRETRRDAPRERRLDREGVPRLAHVELDRDAGAGSEDAGERSLEEREERFVAGEECRFVHHRSVRPRASREPTQRHYSNACDPCQSKRASPGVDGRADVSSRSRDDRSRADSQKIFSLRIKNA